MLVERGGVLLSTVGPFDRWGRPALDAAVDSGPHYLDSTGEPGFLRHVFSRDQEARASGMGLLRAFGYDYVPGNLAGALALERAGERATRLDIAHLVSGSVIRGLSTGTIDVYNGWFPQLSRPPSKAPTSTPSPVSFWPGEPHRWPPVGFERPAPLGLSTPSASST